MERNSNPIFEETKANAALVAVYYRAASDAAEYPPAYHAKLKAHSETSYIKPSDLISYVKLNCHYSQICARMRSKNSKEKSISANFNSRFKGSQYRLRDCALRRKDTNLIV